MALEIKLLSLIDIDIESSFLVLGRNMGVRTKIPTFGFLILGGDEPILVDTGASHAEIMQRLGMTGYVTEEMDLENQLGKYDLAPTDLRWILHTHLHIDHAGQDNRFPTSTTVVINRRELEFSVSGLMGEQYPAEYIKHLIDRLHTPGALRLLDLELSGPEEIIPGVRCEAAGGHTEGSMNVLVDTAEGTACICGDVIYDIQNQIVEPIYQILEFEPQATGNHATTKRQEKGAVKRALQNTFVLPVHDYPARIETGRVISRLKDSVPGPEEPVEMKLPSETGAIAGVDFLPHDVLVPTGV
jgi:glyoxylase-like metal-dependent hydrolase (beta-lactamase superfamily II)